MALILGTFGLAILAWWGSTGLIVLAVRSFEQRHGLVMIGATFMAALGLVALIVSAGSATVAGAFTAFIGALLIWAFFETAFLLGWVTGPRKTPLPADVTSGQRFKFAAETVIHHELLWLARLCSSHLPCGVRPIMWV